jgi:hypothetical protein
MLLRMWIITQKSLDEKKLSLRLGERLPIHALLIPTVA